MNKTETAYAAHLKTLVVANEVFEFWFEPLTIRLSRPDSGQPATYTPDFMVLAPDGRLFMDDVKGSGPVNEASYVRLRAAAELYPLWTWRMARLTRKKNWEIIEV